MKGWEQQLEGKGLKRAGDEEAEGSRKRPSSRQVEKFKQQKQASPFRTSSKRIFSTDLGFRVERFQEKKKKKLTSWLAN